MEAAIEEPEHDILVDLRQNDPYKVVALQAM
jgi:hypothetical protein